MKIAELEKGLKELERRGYYIKIDEIIENSLKEHVGKCTEKYNTLNMELQEPFHLRKIDNKRKDFDELEEEIKTYFQKYDVGDKLGEVIKKLRVYTLDEWTLKDPKKKEYLEKHKKTSLLELYPDKLLLKIWLVKDKYTANRWDFSGYWEFVKTLTDLFNHALGVRLDLSFLKYDLDNAFFQRTYRRSGFDFKFYKNGKLEIRGDSGAIEKINDLIEEYYQGLKESYTLVVRT